MSASKYLSAVSFVAGLLGHLEVNPNCPLSDKQLADLFNNIEDIYRFNR
jgi:hypothetical protein